MKKFLYSPKLIYLLALLLVMVFFLPDLIGPVPAVICGALVIGFALYVYNVWSRPNGPDESAAPPENKGDGDE